jgi:hypothetical protein
MSRRLSRQVIFAKAIARNCSVRGSDLREQRLADIHANFFRAKSPKNIAKIDSPVQVETK